MDIIYDLIESQASSSFIVTIGNFDGVHLGHLAILSRMEELAKQKTLKKVAITFRNHPSDVLNPDHPIPQICTYDQKLRLLESAGVDIVVPLTFTAAFAKQTAQEFLQKVHSAYPIKHLVFGHDATIGSKRHGNRQTIQLLSDSQHYNVEYLPSLKITDHIVSSSQIRSFIAKGSLLEAEEFLGRKYSIAGQIQRGLAIGKNIGYPTLNISLEKLCLPPYGIYAVKVIHRNNILLGIASLGVAPTVRNDAVPLLEVHLFDHHEDIYGDSVEVLFFDFIRPEIKFNTIEEMQVAIAMDVHAAKHCLAAFLA